MSKLVLLLALWPFHHKHMTTVDGCAVQGKLYFYTDESIIGFSPASCEGAKDDWRKLHIEPVRMSRS